MVKTDCKRVLEPEYIGHGIYKNTNVRLQFVFGWY